jgi:hypothetical protein
MTYNKWKFHAILCIKHKCPNFKNAKAPGEFTYKGMVHVISRFTNKILEYHAFYLF